MKYSQETIQNIITLKEQGKSIASISRELHLSPDAVSRNLKKLGYSTERNPMIKNIFHTIDTEEKAYWLGFLCADGYVSKNNQIEVGLQLADIEHLNKLKKFINTNTKIITDSYRCRLCFCSKEMAQDLANLGCTNKKSLTLEFPNQLQVPDELLRHFLRGYVDGDGCICYTEKTKAFSITSTPIFLEKMLERMNWDKNECNYYSSGQALTWRCHTQCIKPYLQELYDNCNIYLDRKYEKFKTLTAV